MPLKPVAQRLKLTLDQLGRCETTRDTLLLVTVARSLADAVTIDTPIPLPSGGHFGERGLLLEDSDGRSAWLLATGRLLRVDAGSDEPVREVSPGEPTVDLVWLVGLLRWVALAVFLGGTPLASRDGMEALAVISDLVAVAWEVDRHGREAILRLLVDAMTRAQSWGPCAQRLKAGFERAVVDSAPAVRSIATRGLVLLACGQVPGISEREAVKTLELLFGLPQADVRMVALETLARQPREWLGSHEDVLRPLIRESLLSPEQSVRHLAGRLELCLPSAGGASDTAQMLMSDDPAARKAALVGLPGGDRQAVEAVLPQVLDAVADPDDDVRQAALEVLRPLSEREESHFRERILVSLLASPDARLAAAAIDQLRRAPIRSPEVLEAVRGAIDGPQASRAEAVSLLAAMATELPSTEAVDAYLGVLRHPDPGVRMALLQALSAGPAVPPEVSDELRTPLLDHLQDPVPALRLEAARAILRQAYPDAVGLVMPLAIDPDPLVHRGLLAILRESGAGEACRVAEVRVRHAETLLDLPDAASGDSRVRWTASLDVLTKGPLPGIADFLAAVLRKIPPGTSDPFLAFATQSLDERILAACSDRTELLRICRRLLQPPEPQPAHAARLAGAVAADEPLALDFLWTLYTLSHGAVSEAARRELAAIGPAAKSPRVRAVLEDMLERETEPARRDVLRTLLGGAAGHR